MKVKLSRDAWLALGLLLVFVLVTALAVMQQARAEAVDPNYVSTSADPNGLRALREWLTALDFTVSGAVPADFAIPDEVDLVIVAEPGYLFTQADLQAVDEWLNEGGTMVLVGQQFATRRVLDNYDIDVAMLPADQLTLTVESPLMSGPVLPNPLPFTTRFVLQPRRDDFVTLLAANGRPAAITFPQGSGRVIATTLGDPWTNAGLQQEARAIFVLNLLSLAGESTERIWFDDWHHGVRDLESGGGNWLQQTPGGQAILLLGTILFLTIALRGRRFGRPLPLPADLSRRTPLEYITAIANLNRRAGHKTAVLQDFHARLKRHLGARYRLNPALPDDEFVARLTAYNPQIDADALRRLLQQLSQKNVSEIELVQLAAAAASWQQN